jgi:sodium/potassium/calcium exchanger 6
MIAARGRGKFLTGLNTLIGGVLIISTIVVGAVTLNVPIPLRLNWVDFSRDMLFLVVTVSIVLVAVLYNPAPLIIAGLLLLCYGTYIALVFVQGDNSQLQYEAVEHEEERRAMQEFLAESQGRTEPENKCNTLLIRLDFAYSALEFPIRTLQHCTIPLLDGTLENYFLWQKFQWAYPFVVPLLVAVWLGSTEFGDGVHRFWSIAICLTISLFLILCLKGLPPPVTEPVLPTTPDTWGDYPDIRQHSSHVQRKRIALFVWLLVAFCSCIMWIDLTANTLVSALSVLGHEIGVPQEFLGLTVLAWGNSIGDCITDTSLARQGRGLMALSGCYGGPLFNMIIGLGVALLLNAMEGDKVVFAAEGAHGLGPVKHADYALQSLLMSVFFLYLVLLSGALMVHCRGYELSSYVGSYLIVVYAAYSIAQCTLLYAHREQS